MSSPRSDAIAAVSFDLGGTLIAPNPGVGPLYAAVCRAKGLRVRPESCDAAFEKAWARRSAAVRTGLDRFSASPGGEDGWWRGVIEEVLQDCGVAPEEAPSVEEFRAAFARADAWRLYDGVEETLDALRERGVRLAIVSNWDSRMDALLLTLGLSRHFETTICSARVGREKPDAEIFHRAVSALGVPPASILHVGDLRREDYHGARDAGMRALWIDRRRGRGGPDGTSGAPAPELDVPAADTIEAIPEILRHLDGRAS